MFQFRIPSQSKILYLECFEWNLDKYNFTFALLRVQQKDILLGKGKHTLRTTRLRLIVAGSHKTYYQPSHCDHLSAGGDQANTSAAPGAWPLSSRVPGTPTLDQDLVTPRCSLPPPWCPLCSPLPPSLCYLHLAASIFWEINWKSCQSQIKRYCSVPAQK